VIRVFGKFFVVVLLMGLSCASGIVVGNGQQHVSQFHEMRLAVASIIASDPQYQSVTCHESSSCVLTVGRTLAEAQQKRFIETVLRQVGEIHSQQFIFMFNKPSS